MSIIKKILVFVFIILSSNLVFSQKTKDNDNLPFLIIPKDPLIAHYSVSKDTSSISISFYINGYESKQKREKAKKERMDKLKKQKRPDEIWLPTFSVNYIDLEKPEKMKNLDGNYRLLNEFNVNNIPLQACIIIKQNDGTYLKWSTVMWQTE